MTCIVGLVHENKVYMAGDSAGVSGLNITVRNDEKVFRKGEFIFGFTTSFRMGQLLRYKLEIPYHKPDQDIYEYMVTDFVEAVRTCLKEGGFARNDNGEEWAGQFMVGYRGRLFVIESDYQVGMPQLPYHALGCGEEYAKGSLYSLQIMNDPEGALLKALGAAQTFSAGVRDPFICVRTD